MSEKFGSDSMTRMTDTNNHQSKYMNFKEAATFLKCSKSKLYHLAQTNKVPAIKFGGSWLFEVKEIEKYLKQHSNIFRVS